MPAEKGIPKPEANCQRIDVRHYDSREAWGWISEDEQFLMSKDGKVYMDIELVCISFDENWQKYNLEIHKHDGKRILRWMRQIADFTNRLSIEDIDVLENK